jgi:hypothetical protein
MKKLLLPLAMILLVVTGCLAAPAVLNKPPIAYIDSVSPTNSTCGDAVTFTGHGIDPDGTVVAYSWRASPEGNLSDAASFTTSSLTPGSHSVWFKVQDNGGAWSEEVMAIVNVVAAGTTRPVINSFTASPGSISPGGSSTLSWNVSGCTHVVIDQAIGTVSLNGTRLVSPTTTTSYTLTAINEVGTTVATAQVIVTKVPVTRVELYSIAAEDGQVRRDGFISRDPIAGDTQSGTAIQAFLSFDLSAIQKGATITSVSLDLPVSDLFGSPFETLGRLYIYECKYTQLSSSDFASGMIMPGALYTTNVLIMGPISSDPLVNAIKTKVDEGSNRFQIRVQFEKQQIFRGSSAQTYNNLADYIAFNPAQTKLIVEFQY